MTDDDDDAPPLGVKDLAVLTAFVEIPKQGGKLNLANIERYTGLDVKEIFEILTFLEEHDFVVIDRNKMQ